jgi:hypothetical protein
MASMPPEEEVQEGPKRKRQRITSEDKFKPQELALANEKLHWLESTALRELSTKSKLDIPAGSTEGMSEALESLEICQGPDQSTKATSLTRKTDHASGVSFTV